MPVARRTALTALALAALLAAPAAAAPVPAEVEVEEAAAERAAPRSSLVPIPIVYYSPETRMAFGGAATWLLRPEGSTLDDRPSRLMPLLIVTTRSQILLGLFAEHYADGERSLIRGGLMWRKFPDSFYGIGNENAEDGDEGYTDEGVAVSLEYEREVLRDLRVGAAAEYATSSIQETTAGDRLHDGSVLGSEGGRQVGVGAVAAYDSRDNINFPRRGAFHGLRWMTYPDALGSDFDFDRLTADLRLYRPVGGRAVLALRALGEHARRHVPFQSMPALGGDSLLRGYYGGRFRDHSLLAFQAEYRGPLAGRLGWAAFAGAGQVGPDPGALAVDRFHGCWGLGLRYLLVAEEGLQLRMDLGFGEDSSGFYLGLGEVF